MIASNQYRRLKKESLGCRSRMHDVSSSLVGETILGCRIVLKNFKHAAWLFTAKVVVGWVTPIELMMLAVSVNRKSKYVWVNLDLSELQSLLIVYTTLRCRVLDCLNFQGRDRNRLSTREWACGSICWPKTSASTTSLGYSHYDFQSSWKTWHVG